MIGFEQAKNVAEVLRQHALQRPEQDAVTLVSDPGRAGAALSMSYRQLDSEARRIASWLQQRCALGDRVLLLYAPGLNFAAAFFGCIYAGMVAVPAPLPGQHQHQQRRVHRIATDAAVAAILTDSGNLGAVAEWAAAQQLDDITRLATDTADFGDPEAWRMPAIGRDTLVLLQYTSGSTGEPKGVMVTHNNLLHNVDSLRRAYGLTEHTRFGGWIPLYHDMGLMGLLLPALFLGSTCILITPTTFLKRPHLWLRMIDRYDIGFSAAPNFAFELCLRRVTEEQLAELDLSRWRYAANGSEPVQAHTIVEFAKRFAAAGFGADVVCPCYGMAETTLFVSGNGRRLPVLCRVDSELLERHRFAPLGASAAAGGNGRELVSCGTAHDFDVLIADPVTCNALPPGAIGEIWLRGPSVAQGYWRNPQATSKVFNASASNGDGGYFRTGDLGVLHGGELYVTGRFKEMLIVHGRNLYPQDIEHEVRAQHAELSTGAGAVFTVAAPHEEVVVTHEIRGQCGPDLLRELALGVKTTVLQELGLRVAAVVLLRPGSVLRTTSGKIQRAAMRELFINDGLSPVYEEVAPHLHALRQARRAGSLPPPVLETMAQEDGVAA
ncbi:fatty acyl-AMP ligase [Paraherbaspirillum soli]|uniref:Fatty acyl-AMP ligase n=1 Tax=Paraherbaspirillum soli TaxID=631222 RepID=A0ABW0MGA4_9BURK